MPRSTRPINRQILDEAAEWFVELEGEDVDLPTRQSFDAWLRRSPEHVQAFLELLPVWERAGSMGAPTEVAEQLIARVLGSHGNVVAFSQEKTRDAPRAAIAADTREVSSRPARKSFAAAVAATVVLSLGSALWFAFATGDTYATQIAEQRSIVLADGSSVELNTRSRIRVRFTEHERRVDLLEGQALFHVAKDSARPFTVNSADVRVRAVGTQFDVYRQQDRTIVTVVEGRVAVLPRSSGSIFLSAGEQSVATAAAVGAPAPANTAATTAWTQRRLVFQKTALVDVVNEFNRYNKRPLRISDERTRSFVVSGTFSSTDPASLLRFLRAQPGIHVVEATDAVRIESSELYSAP